MSEQQSLDKQIISQVAERSIANQLEAAEQIDIYVETDILKIVQGQVDGVTFAGQGLVTKENIRVQEIKLKTDSIDINPLSAIFGQIKLKKPVNFIARVTLTEADLNHALNSQIFQNLVRKFQIQVDDTTVNFSPQTIQIFLHDNEKIELQGKVKLHENAQSRFLEFNAIILHKTHSHPIMLESFNCIEGGGFSLDLIVSLTQKLQKIANLPSFQWEDINLTIINLEIHKKTLILLIEANVIQLPESVK